MQTDVAVSQTPPDLVSIISSGSTACGPNWKKGSVGFSLKLLEIRYWGPLGLPRAMLNLSFPSYTEFVNIGQLSRGVK